MLCLSRKEDESIVCLLPNGDEVEVLVRQINGNQVKLGINAPADIQILREEPLAED